MKCVARTDQTVCTYIRGEGAQLDERTRGTCRCECARRMLYGKLADHMRAGRLAAAWGAAGHEATSCHVPYWHSLQVQTVVFCGLGRALLACATHEAQQPSATSDVAHTHMAYIPPNWPSIVIPIQLKQTGSPIPLRQRTHKMWKCRVRRCPPVGMILVGVRAQPEGLLQYKGVAPADPLGQC